MCVGLAGANAARAEALPVLGIACAAAAAAFALEGTARVVALVLALAGAGWVWGSFRLDALDRSVLVTRIGHVDRSVAEVTAPARHGQFELRVLVKVRSFGEFQVDEPALLELPPGRAPPQGAVIETVAEAKPPRPPEDGFDERAWLARQGIHVVIRGRSWHQLGRRGGLAGVADQLRAFLGVGVAPGVHGERAALIKGVVLGADEGLSQELQYRFRQSGLYHLLAVSGQNIAIIAGAVLLLAALAGIPRWLGEVSVLAAIGGYVLAVGLQPSVVRAGIAGALASLAWLASRPRDRWYFLLVGGIALLAWNPYNLLEPGFQLSFAAVGAIFMLVPRIERVIEGYPVPRLLAMPIAVSSACGLCTAPLLWLDFGRVPIYSVVANVLAEPAMPFLLGLGLIAAVVHPVLPVIAEALAWVNGWFAAYLAWCARFVGGLPRAQVSSLRGLLLVADAGLLAWFFIRLQRPRLRRAGELCAVGLAVGLGWRLLG